MADHKSCRQDGNDVLRAAKTSKCRRAWSQSNKVPVEMEPKIKRGNGPQTSRHDIIASCRPKPFEQVNGGENPDQERWAANRRRLIKKYGEELVRNGGNLKHILAKRNLMDNCEKPNLDAKIEDNLQSGAGDCPGADDHLRAKVQVVERTTKNPSKMVWTSAERKSYMERLTNQPPFLGARKLLPISSIPGKKTKSVKNKSAFSSLNEGNPPHFRVLRVTELTDVDGKDFIKIKCENNEESDFEEKSPRNPAAKNKLRAISRQIKGHINHIITDPDHLFDKYDSDEELVYIPCRGGKRPPEFLKNVRPAWTKETTPFKEKAWSSPVIQITKENCNAANSENNLDSPMCAQSPKTEVGDENWTDTDESSEAEIQYRNENESKSTDSESSSAVESESSSNPNLNIDSSGPSSKTAIDDQVHPTADGNEVERELVVQNYAELLEFFSAKNLTQFEKSTCYDDDPNRLKKYYSIVANNDCVEYKINRANILDHLDEFIKMPVAIGFVLRCRVFRNTKGVDRGFFPTYTMHLESSKCRDMLLMMARKRKKSATPNYLISIDPLNLVREGNSVVGKLGGNMIGTHFTIYDDGHSPSKYDLLGSGSLREELGAVTYEPNVLGFKGPRKMVFLVPAMISESKRFEHHPEGEHDSIVARNKKGIKHRFVELRNKTPVYNTIAHSFVLNFHGRVTHASVKNFQIIHPNLDNYTVLQFGKAGEDAFSLDIKYPLCPLQAFGIALSSFANKWVCE